MQHIHRLAVSYGEFVIDRFTQDVTPLGPGQPKRARIYWLVSTWNPYVVVMMPSMLELHKKEASSRDSYRRTLIFTYDIICPERRSVSRASP